MTSTTGTKKELIDFPWDWAETNRDWSKHLLIKLLQRKRKTCAFIKLIHLFAKSY
jgi:hypothetical protein